MKSTTSRDSMQLTNLMVLCTKLQTQVLDLEKANDAQAKEIAALKKRVQRLERKKKSRPTCMKRLKKVGMSRRVTSSEDQESLGDPEDASKQGRSITDLDKDDDVTLVDETQERQDDELMFDTRVLDTDEMSVEAKVGEKDKQSTKLDDSTAGEAVTTASVEAKHKVVTTAATTTTTIRPKARGVVVQEPSEFKAPQEAQPSISKDKGKGIMIEPEVPLKRKNQIALDEQIAKDIQAKLDVELIDEEKLARKQEEEANIAFIDNEKNVEGSEEKTKASRKKMLGRKRAGKEQQQESSKKQRIEEDKELYEVEEDDEAELKKYLVIKKDKYIAIDVIPLATKPPVIIDYKLLKEGIILSTFRPTLGPQNPIIPDLNPCFNQGVVKLRVEVSTTTAYQLLGTAAWEIVSNPFSSTTIGYVNPIRTLGDYSKPSHEGYRNTIELPIGINVSTSNRCLIELEHQVQRLMEAYIALMKPTQVNKITSSCEICSGCHDTQYDMENPEQAFVDHASSYTDGIGEELNRNPSSPKCVHFVILYKEDKSKEEENVKSSTTEYEDHEMTVESEKEFEEEVVEEIKEE
ncbi:hypothetical protein Tco_0001699 [Tanacetum coccineum]